MGPPVGHDLVPVHGHGAGGVGGAAGRGGDRPRLPVRDAGFQAEGLVWTDDGPLQGVHPRRTAVPLPDAKAGEPVEVVLEAAANPWFPSLPALTDGLARHRADRPLYRLRQADLAVLDRTVYDLVLDVEVLDGTMRALPLDDPRRARLLRTLERAFDALDLDDVGGTAGHGARVLAPALALPARASAHTTVAVGHAHIDTAWLWPLRETVRKCTRTFASAVRLMDDEPDYRFVCSQAAQQEWMRDPPSRPLRPHAGEGRRRAVDPGRRHVGRGRHEPAERRVDRAPARPRSAVLRGALRPALPRGLDPGRLRLPRLAPAALRGRRLHPLRHAEAVVEQGEPLPPQHVLVGGHRRDAGC